MPTALAEKLRIAQKSIAGLDPYAAFRAVCRRPGVFFLDSSLNEHGMGRMSLLGCDPFLILRSRGDAVEILGRDGSATSGSDPFGTLEELLDRYSAAEGGFGGAAVGYLGYDLGRLIEVLPARARDDLALPEMHVGFYDAVARFDLASGACALWAVETGDGARPEEKIESLARLLAGPGVPRSDYRPPGVLESNFERPRYEQAVARAMEYIAAGDIFQVNLSQRFRCAWGGPAEELYARLREANPAPFSCFLDCGGGQVLSSSPERFLKLEGDMVQTRPIKGTRSRGGGAEEDMRLAAELLASEKDNAELAMIIDLERNDLGRVCRYGTVAVEERRALETHPTVFHLVSTVTGRLREGAGRVDLVRAAFPGGSITGAPKIRAMEIIEELEPTRRGVYTGAIGYFGFDGTMDLNIAIRTMVKRGGDVYFQAGGGIVADSAPAAEYEETMAKAKALIRALGGTA